MHARTLSRAILGGLSPHLIDLHELPIACVEIRNGVFFAQNRVFEAITGWKSTDVVGKPMTELVARLLVPADAEIVLHRMRTAPADPPPTGGRLWCRLKAADGRALPMRIEWHHGAEGVTLVTLVDARPEAFGQEVTEALARAAGTLSAHASEREVLEHAVEALWAHGFTTTTLIIDEAEPLLRYGPSRTPSGPSMVGKLPQPRRDILTTLNPAFMQRRAAFFQDGMRVVRETYPEPVAQRILAMLPADRMVQAPLFVDGEPYGAMVVTSNDLSPLVATALELFAEFVGKAIEALRLRNERVERGRLAALGEAASVMAHEVRNPVASIMNALTLLKREEEPSSTKKALLGIIEEESSRLDHVISQLLDLGRPLIPRPHAYAAEKLAERAARVLGTRGELADRHLELPSSGNTLAWMDADLMELALLNVLRNAVQSTPAGARIRVSVDTEGAFVRCAVDDEGPGMPDEVVGRLGQPFVTTRATGTGMGLAVVRRIVEASGGRLSVARGALGGARLTLEIPRAP